MAKKLNLLALLLTLSLATFSQTGTNNTICFPDSTAKKIAIDLVRGDSAKAELTKTKILVDQLQEKITLQQRTVNVFADKVANYETQVDLFRKKEVKYNEIVTGLETDVKKFKRRNTYLKISVGILTVTTAIGFIIH